MDAKSWKEAMYQQREIRRCWKDAQQWHHKEVENEDILAYLQFLMETRDERLGLDPTNLLLRDAGFYQGGIEAKNTCDFVWNEVVRAGVDSPGYSTVQSRLGSHKSGFWDGHVLLEALAWYLLDEREKRQAYRRIDGYKGYIGYLRRRLALRGLLEYWPDRGGRKRAVIRSWAFRAALVYRRRRES